MPHERLRCLAWGQDLLQDIERDEAVPLELRQAAGRLRSSYPSADDLHRVVRTRAATLSTEHAAAIQAARELFGSVHRSGDGRAETRRFVLFILRHCPTNALTAAWERGFFPAIGDWLALDA